jgi:hypothetical protein
MTRKQQLPPDQESQTTALLNLPVQRQKVSRRRGVRCPEASGQSIH